MSDSAEAPPHSPPARHSSSPAGLFAPSSQDHNNTPLAVDENPEDDLGISMDPQSATTSLTSSVFRYRKENGRTYHAYKDGAYVLPNDEAENERLDYQHVICLEIFGRLHYAPVEKHSLRVLDVGCGTGVWSFDFADKHPDAEVTGVDLSPIQPTFVPPNVTFFVDDVEDYWTYSRPFDFIFSRFLTGSIKDWPKLFRRSFQSLNPGGCIELQDIIFPVASDDNTLPEDSYLGRWSERLTEAFWGTGRPINSALHYEQQLAEAGFVNIRVIREKWPTNHWPRDKKYKQLGIWNLENFSLGLSAFSLEIFTRPTSENGLGWSQDEVEVLLTGVRKDLRNTGIHAYFHFWAVYAQKPE